MNKVTELYIPHLLFLMKKNGKWTEIFGKVDINVNMVTVARLCQMAL